MANEFTQLGTLTDDASKNAPVDKAPDVDSSGSVIEPSDKTMTKLKHLILMLRAIFLLIWLMSIWVWTIIMTITRFWLLRRFVC